MKSILAILLAATAFSFTAHAGFEAKTSTKSLGIAKGFKCVAGLNCTLNKKTGDLQVQLVGGTLTAPTVASTSTIATEQCGTMFINSATATMTLPTATSSVGCVLHFAVANASAFIVNPNGTDRILGLTDANGDAISNSTVGGTVTLRAMNATQWVVMGSYGTWTDAN